MNWDDLKIVLAIYRTRSMSQAARLLKIDPSTAARRLTAIEADLGTILFSRSKSGLAVTDAGRIAVEHALEMELRAERLVNRLPRQDETPSGTVRLISNPWILTQLAGFGLSALRKANPDIELVMIASTRRRSIAIGETDLALWFELRPEDGEFAIPLGDVPYGLYAPLGVPAETVAWMTIWNVEQRIEPMRWLTAHLPADHKMALKSNDPPALLAAIAAGLGKALIPVCMGSRDSRVVRVRGIVPEVQRRLHLHTHPDLVQSPKIQVTMAWIRSVFSDVFSDRDADQPMAAAGPDDTMTVSGPTDGA